MLFQLDSALALIHRPRRALFPVAAGSTSQDPVSVFAYNPK